MSMLNEQGKLKAHVKPVCRDGLAESVDPGLSFKDDPGRTDQSQAAACNVNSIMERFLRTGVLPGVDAPRLYGDFSDVPDYHEAMGIVARANEQFAGLNAQVRARFSNDPALFLAFCNDPGNAQEMIKLGLATEAPPAAPKGNSGDPRASGGAQTPPLPAAPEGKATPKAPSGSGA